MDARAKTKPPPEHTAKTSIVWKFHFNTRKKRERRVSENGLAHNKCVCIYKRFPMEFKEYFWAFFFCFMSAFMTLMECRTSNGMQIFVKCFVLVKKVVFQYERTEKKGNFICATWNIWNVIVFYSLCYFVSLRSEQLSCLFVCILFMLMIVDRRKTSETKWMATNAKKNEMPKPFRHNWTWW